MKNLNIKKMYKIERLDLEFNKGKAFVLNEGNLILKYQWGKNSNNARSILIYEKSDKLGYKLKNEFNYDCIYGLIYMTMLTNESIITSGRNHICIFKKENESYKLFQKLSKCYNWAEITKIKELNNGGFAVCGWHGFMIFNQQKDSNKYELIFDIYRDILETRWIIDFMEIKGKEKKFILCGDTQAIIILDNKIINRFLFDEIDRKSIFEENYICKFHENLFLFQEKVI